MSRVAVFRPDDDRLADAVARLESLGVEPVADPLLATEPTGAIPRSDADFVILTSKTGVELVAGQWDPGAAAVCAIGSRTAAAVEAAGWPADVVPETYSSQGLVDALDGEVGGRRVEVARSDHGSDVLLEGLDAAGAYHHETVLYRLTRPEGSGESVAMAAAGDLDATLFTSSLTVEHFIDAAVERGERAAAIDGVNTGLVGAIGDPTRRTAEANGIRVDVVPERATFEALAAAVVDRLDT